MSADQDGTWVRISATRVGLALVAGWIVAVGASYGWNLHQLEHQIQALALSHARVAHQKHVDYRAWVAKRGGVYVEASELTPPNPLLEGLVDERDILTPSGRHLTLVNPAYMSRQVMEESRRDDGILSRLTSLDPIRPQNKADTWETEALHFVEQLGHDHAQSVSLIDGKEYLRYLEALPVIKPCMPCHEQQGYKVGDVRGAIAVAVPMTPLRDSLRPQHLQVALTHAAAALGGLILILVLTRQLSRAQTQIERRNQDLAAARDAALEDRRRIEDTHATLVQTHQQLLQSDKLASIGKLAAGVAHEINNPLAFVNSNLGALEGYTQRLSDVLGACETAARTSDPDALRATLADAELSYIREDLPALIQESREGLGRVTRIVQSLKDFSRVDQSARQPADLNAGMQCTIDVVWNELKYKATVIRELGELPLVTCAPAEINQVFMNLLLNAAQAIEDHGTIHVRSGRAEGGVWFEVEDNGSGMSEEVRHHLFEPFFTTRPVGTGTGLGLSTSYDIVVKKHGGRMEAFSEPGRGARFRIWLPIA